MAEREREMTYPSPQESHALESTHGAAGRPSVAAQIVADVKLFTRFEYLTFAAILPLIGASSVSARLSTEQIVGLIAVAVSFHIYVSLLNDVADLPLDRSNPRRANYPLVRGSVTPSQALIVVFLQIPIAAGLTLWLGGSAWAYGALALGIGLMTVYDLFGKRLPFPPMVDVIQGVGFAAMTVYGAAIAGTPNRLTIIVFLLIVVWMVLTNLIGGLRDLNTDSQFGVSTTPIFFGARARGGCMDIPGPMALYAHSVLGLLIGIELTALFYNDFGYTGATLGALVLAVSVLGSTAIALLSLLFRTASEGATTMSPVMGLQLAFSSLGVLAPFAAYLDRWLLLVIAAIFACSFGDFDPRPLIEHWRKRSVRI
jgi:4-hydroxybenzoate polyprenyltransferase